MSPCNICKWIKKLPQMNIKVFDYEGNANVLDLCCVPTISCAFENEHKTTDSCTELTYNIGKIYKMQGVKSTHMI